MTQILNQNDTILQQVDRIYTIITGLTIAFLAVSFSKISKEISPVNILWIVTVWVVFRDWIQNDSQNDRNLDDRIKYLVFTYLLILILLPLAVIIIESGIVGIWIYPAIILLFTAISLIYSIMLIQKEHISPHSDSNISQIRNLLKDIISIIIYGLLLLYFSFNQSNTIVWKDVILIAISVIFFEEFGDRLLLNIALKLIQK